MTEKQFKELLKTLKIGNNKSNVEIKELLDAKLNEYLDRQDESAEDMVSDIQDALDYVEELIEKMGGGIALALDESEEAEETEEINRDLLGQAAKNGKKGAAAFTSSADMGGQAGTNVQGTSASAGGVNPKGKPWFYSLYGDQKVEDMFEMAESDLNQGDFKHAASVFDMILKIEVANPGAYMGKVLATHHLKNPNDIAACFDNGLEYDSDLKRLESIGNDKQKKFIRDILEERRKAQIYMNIEKKVLQKKNDYIILFDAAARFESLGNYRDAAQKADTYKKEAERLKEEKERKQQEELYRKAESALLRCNDIWELTQAAKMFKSLGNYRDAEKKVEECKSAVERLEKYQEEQREEARKYQQKLEEEKKRKELEEKERAKKKRMKNIVVAMIATIAISFFVYFRYMTPTYYGTMIYFGKWFYDECTIADSAKKIAPGTFSEAKISSIVIPDSVEKIENLAFADCTYLRNIEIPDSVTEIGSKAFSGCTSLENIELSKNVQNIGFEAFANCNALKSIRLPDSLERIEASAFSGCTSLKEVTFGKGPQLAENFGEEIFKDCVRLEKLTLPVTVEGEISDSILENCSSISPKDIQKEYFYGDNANDYDDGGISNNLDLFVEPIDNVPIVENETQLFNILANLYIEVEDPFNNGYIVFREERITNLVSEEKVDDSGREIAVSFDYEKEDRIIHIVGTIRQEWGNKKLETEFRRGL